MTFARLLLSAEEVILPMAAGQDTKEVAARF